jgi:hypothetical protein
LSQLKISWAYRLVLSEARDGTQSGQFVKAPVNRTPEAASVSRLGVLVIPP